MEPLSLCPTCHQTLTIVGTFQICPLHGQVSLEPKPISPLRIFLSYGHDHNEELIRLIKTDLEKRGHDVWFDKNEIKFGDEWRRSITDGILGSNRVLSFLSKHSTRDPGVCRDEIAIAIGVKGGNIQTILVESEKEVQPPVNIGHIQWLDMHEWHEKKAINETEWEQWYQAKLAEIVQVVESDESRRFAGEIDKLNEYLKPIKSDARISGLLSKGFYGREWLFDAVENWRSGSGSAPSPLGGEGRGEGLSRLFWIMGDPGVGKSAFAAQLTHKRGDTVLAAQFCEWDKPDHRDAKRVVCSIAFQLATRLPDYRKLLLTLPEIKELDRKDASELFDYLLANPLKSVITGGRERHLIVIDALDEAGESGRNPLVEMLARNAHLLPAWLGIVVTSRPEFDVKTPFQALNPLPIDTKSESNKADIRDYINNKLATELQNQPNAEALVNQILEKSEGVFLYAERFCEDVYLGHISLDQPDRFPQGLGGIFAQYFHRQFPDLEKFRKEIRPTLRAILAAREPLPLEILQKLFTWEDEELRDFTHTFGSLFPVTKTTESETIKPYHKSLADWMGNKTKAGVYFMSVKAGHAILAESGLRAIKTRTEPNSIFWLRHALFHLNQCGRDSDAAELASEKWFIEQRFQCGLKNIFLSYSLDATEIAERLFTDLTSFGHIVWRHANEGTGDIHDAVNSADLLIALLTRRSTRMRSWSYRETLEAVSQGKIVLPVRATSREFTAPFHLRRPRYIDLSSDYATGLNELRQTLGELKQHAEAGVSDPEPVGGLVERASHLASDGRFGESELLYRRALAETEHSLGREHIEVGQRLDDLGQLLFSTNRLNEAEPLMRRALGIYEKGNGENHPTVATALSNLALLLQSKNRLSDAETLLRRALAIDESSFGPEHPSATVRLNNLVQLLCSTGRYAEAETLMRRVLGIYEQTLGKDHSALATALNNLALLLQTTNRSTEAELLLRRALNIEERYSGEDHRDVATAINNLAVLLQTTNRLDEAEVLMRRVLVSHEASYGRNHPNVASVLSTLGDMLCQKGSITEADLVFRKALAIWENNLGNRHPHVVSIRRKLAQLTARIVCDQVHEHSMLVEGEQILENGDLVITLTEANKPPSEVMGTKYERGTAKVPMSRIDLVHFSVSSPPAAQAGKQIIVDVWAHLEQQRAEVANLVQQASIPTEAPPVIRPKGPFKIERGTMLFVRLKFQDLIVEPEEDVILWEGEIGNASFVVSVPAEISKGMRIGSLTVHCEGGFQIARIPLQLLIADEVVHSEPIEQTLHRVRKAFVSYARADLDEVLSRIQGMQKIIPDLDVFLDVVKLRSGEDWEKRLWTVIPESDVFYLFWSTAAKESTWVEKEWRCALSSRGVDFIDPVPLVSPKEVPPPEELSKMHFNDWSLAYRRGKTDISF